MQLEYFLKDSQLFLKRSGSRWLLILAAAAAIGITALGLYKVYELKKSKEEIPAPAVTAPVKIVVTALGRLEPRGEAIKLTAPGSLEGTRVAQLLVKQGDKITVGQVVAILDSREQRTATLEEAKKQIQVVRANLAKVKAGAKAGEIGAQKAEIARLQAELNGEIATQRATVARLQAQLDGERKTQQATVARLQAQLNGERKTQQATVARLRAELDGERKTQQATVVRMQAQLRNAELEFKRYESLYKQGAVQASRFDTEQLELETARAQVNETKANLTRTEETLQQQIREATANLSRIEETLVQQVNEAKANLIKTEQTLQQQINEAESTRDRTVNTLQEQILQAKANLNQIAEVRPTDVLAAQAEIEKAIATAKRAQADLDLSFVKSPLVGQVITINSRPGERIGDDGIIEIGETDRMDVVAEVYETEIDKVRLGLPATVRSTAFSGVLKGTVDELGLKIGKKNILNDDPAADQDARVVEVKIRLNAEDSKRVANLTNLQVEVAIDASPTNSNPTPIPAATPIPENAVPLEKKAGN